VAITNEIFPGDASHAAGPYGFGVRVPMLVVSPWSRGGWVNSQLFDHTSLIRFLEARFAHHHPDLIEANITPWRRAVAGDLTTAFDFKTPNGSRRVVLPSTADFKPEDFERHPDEVLVPPVHQAVPDQEDGVRPARAIPYTLDATGTVRRDDSSFWIEFRNTGDAAAVFHVRSGHSTDAPRTYTVEAHKQVSDSWSVATSGASAYDLSVYGPNGFYRAFKGAVAGNHGALVDVRAHYDEHDNSIALEIANRGPHTANVRIFNRYTSQRSGLEVRPGDSGARSWSLKRVSGWYDLTLTVDGDAQFAYHAAGHVENGEDSISDPLMGGLV
jgi:phospholipase C